MCKKKNGGRRLGRALGISLWALCALPAVAGPIDEWQQAPQTLWPGYNEVRCKGNRVEQIVHIETMQAAADRALVYAEVRGVEPGDPDAKLVALTFDLCEQANERTGYHAELVNLLRREQVHATFCAGGKWMRSHPEKAMQVQADPLFEVGNHTWTHGNLRVLRGQEVYNQIVWTQAQYRIVRDELAARPCARGAGAAELARIPAYPTTFRFPYGTCSRESLDALAGYGLAAIQRSIVTGDPWKGQTANGIVRTVLNGIAGQRGAIVIAHANGRGWRTTEAITRLIPALRERGYDFVTVSELLATGEPHAEKTCYELRPGDNARYDALFGRGTGDVRR